MDPDMALEKELIREIRTDRGWTIEHVAIMTGYSKSHVHRFECAENGAVVPVHYLAGLFRATRDPRIPQLIMPGLQVCHVGEPQPVTVPDNPMDLLVQEMEAHKQSGKLIEYLYRIVRDQRVDERDDQVLNDYAESCNRLQALMNRNRLALHAMREHARKETGK